MFRKKYWTIGTCCATIMMGGSIVNPDFMDGLCQYCQPAEDRANCVAKYLGISAARSAVFGATWPVTVPFTLISTFKPSWLGLDLSKIDVPEVTVRNCGKDVTKPQFACTNEWAYLSIIDPFYEGERTYTYLWRRILNRFSVNSD